MDFSNCGLDYAVVYGTTGMFVPCVEEGRRGSRLVRLRYTTSGEQDYFDAPDTTAEELIRMVKFAEAKDYEAFGKIKDEIRARRNAREEREALRLVPVDAVDGIYHADQGYGCRGYSTRYWIRVEEGHVNGVAHEDGRDHGELPNSWEIKKISYHLSHFPGFDPTEEAFGSSHSGWKKLDAFPDAQRRQQAVA